MKVYRNVKYILEIWCFVRKFDLFVHYQEYYIILNDIWDRRQKTFKKEQKEIQLAFYAYFFYTAALWLPPKVKVKHIHKCTTLNV